MDSRFRDILEKYSRKGRVKIDWDAKRIQYHLETSSPYYEKEVFLVFKDGSVKKLLDCAFLYRDILSNIVGGVENLPWEVERLDFGRIITALAILPDNIREQIIAIIQRYDQIRYIPRNRDGWGEDDVKVYTLKEPTFIITPFEKALVDTMLANSLLFKKIGKKLVFPLALPIPQRRSRVSNIFRNLLHLARV